ncbi:TetR/AcrR family transcriptional regulator [Burkholderia territorii]|uniref:TetR/AcrR family transcriptional regulator n=1 Tax=Burkholderia territorii TaxID=1503055 RepID=UPI0039BF3BDD
MKDQTTANHHPAAGRHAHDDSVSGRERLLDAAIDLFAAGGIANTTVAQIAAADKMTSAMVHYWFETREKLYDAIVDERLVPHPAAPPSSDVMYRSKSSVRCADTSCSAVL